MMIPTIALIASIGLNSCKKDVEIDPPSEIVDIDTIEINNDKPVKLSGYFSFDSEKWVMNGMYHDQRSLNGGIYQLELKKIKDTIIPNGSELSRWTKLEGVEQREGYADRSVRAYFIARNSSYADRTLYIWDPLESLVQPRVDSIGYFSTDSGAIEFHGKSFWSFKDRGNSRIVWGASLSPLGLPLRSSYIFRIKESMYIVEQDTLFLH
jgi:hypothetical protein